MYEYRHGTRAQARENRRNVRAELGTSGDNLPDVLAVLRAARALAALLDNASGGAYGLSVHRFFGPDQGVDVPIGTAITEVVERRQAERLVREMTAGQ